MHSHRILRNECSITEAMDIDADSRILNHMPFFHVAGAFTGVLPPLITGGAMVLMDGGSRREALELIERERVTVFSGIPTHFIDLLNHPTRSTARRLVAAQRLDRRRQQPARGHPGGRSTGSG